MNLANELISVSDLNKLAKALLDNNMPHIWIKGELSGVRLYGSTYYFDLKDEQAKIACVIFANNTSRYDFKLENGKKVKLQGKVTLYIQNGTYQIIVERICQLGIGELWENYNRLLNKLKQEGLFDSSHKKALPLFPQAIGVITSTSGAVLRDIVTTLRRRMPNIPIVVYNTLVQGALAALQIAKAIRIANRRKDAEVLIICRGGGSMEDLWCFNDEILVREVFASAIPIISAIGHETDTTLIDYVADLRAPTPTAAAELVAKSSTEWQSLLNDLANRLSNKLCHFARINALRIQAASGLLKKFTDYRNNKCQQLDLTRKRFTDTTQGFINKKRERLDLYSVLLLSLKPTNLLQIKINIVRDYEMRLTRAMINLLKECNYRLCVAHDRLLDRRMQYLNIAAYYATITRCKGRLQRVANLAIGNSRKRLTELNNCLRLINPENVLTRGYAIIKSNSGKQVIQSVTQAKINEELEITLQDGVLAAVVTTATE